jgi:hypothetical protein
MTLGRRDPLASLRTCPAAARITTETKYRFADRLVTFDQQGNIFVADSFKSLRVVSRPHAAT